MKWALPKIPLAGDALKAVLEAAGLTEERVAKALGRPCRCPQRRAKLNEWDAWARQAARESAGKAAEYLKAFVEGWEGGK